MNIKMKKIVIALILIFSFMILGNTEVYASVPTITVNSPEVGGDLKVTIVFGSDVCSYEGNLKVVFKNGTEYNFGKIGDGIFNYGGDTNKLPRTLSYTTKATVEGAGTVQLTNLELGDSSFNALPVGTSYGAAFTVKAKAQAPATNPTTPPATTTPTTNTTTTPSTNTTTTPNNQSAPTMNNVSTGSTTPVGGTTTNTTTEKPKEEEKKPEPIKVTMKEEVKKTMYVDVSSCNVRNADSKKAEIIGGYRKGAKVEVTGITTNGWYRINYYNEVAYVADVLSNEKPEVVENEVKNEVENKVENKVTNKVENKEKNEIKNEIKNEVSNDVDMENALDNTTNELEELKNSIGVIPEVGNNIFDVLFVIVTVMAIGYVFYVSYKNRDEV